MKKIFLPAGLMVYLVFINACKKVQANTSRAISQKKQFNTHWNAGKAELNHYELTQARYGELHKGHAVLVFVTEPFLKKKQVKPDGHSSDSIQVLKTNRLHRFTTGVYDYSLMNSTFTPIQIESFQHSIKITTTVQDWCGHVFSQFNLKGDDYRIRSFSYFESESDQDQEISASFHEDEVLNRIRIAPQSLPRGKIKVIASSFYTRLLHKDIGVVDATASLSNNKNHYFATGKATSKLTSYEIDYPSYGRKVSYVFEEKFPHKIIGWQEEYYSGFTSTKKLISRAKLKKNFMLAYWSKNGLKDAKLRVQLGLKKNWL